MLVYAKFTPNKWRCRSSQAFEQPELQLRLSHASASNDGGREAQRFGPKNRQNA